MYVYTAGDAVTDWIKKSPTCKTNNIAKFVKTVSVAMLYIKNHRITHTHKSKNSTFVK